MRRMLGVLLIGLWLVGCTYNGAKGQLPETAPAPVSTITVTGVSATATNPPVPTAARTPSVLPATPTTTSASTATERPSTTATVGLVDAMLTPSFELVPTSAAPNDNYVSGGLGMSRAQWEQSYAHTGTMGPAMNPTIEEYEGGSVNGGFQVSFRFEDRASYIAKAFLDPVSEAEAIAFAEGLIPADARIVDAFSTSGYPYRMVRLYDSPSLAARFDAEFFCEGSPPGQFAVVYNTFPELAGKVETFFITIGCSEP